MSDCNDFFSIEAADEIVEDHDITELQKKVSGLRISPSVTKMATIDPKNVQNDSECLGTLMGLLLRARATDDFRQHIIKIITAIDRADVDGFVNFIDAIASEDDYSIPELILYMLAYELIITDANQDPKRLENLKTMSEFLINAEFKHFGVDLYDYVIAAIEHDVITLEKNYLEIASTQRTITDNANPLMEFMYMIGQIKTAEFLVDQGESLSKIACKLILE